MPLLCCYLLWPVTEAQSHGSRSARGEERAARVAGPPDLLQMGQCQRTACKERGCEVEISHRAAQGLE